MTLSIPFDTISQNIRTITNHAEFNTSRAVQGANRKRNKILMIGRRLTTGTVAELTLKQVLSGDQAESFHGTGSELAEMVRAGKRANSQTEMWTISIAPLTGGTAGTKTITITGPATGDGTIHLYIAGRFYVPVAVTNTTVQNTIATAIDTAIKAHAEYKRMPFTSSVSTNVVTLTMRWKGVDVADVRTNYNASDTDVAGVTVACAAGVAGAGNPDIASVISAIGDVTQWDNIAMPFTDTTNLSALETELRERWGGMEQIDGVAFATVPGSHGTASSAGAARNSAFTSLMAANTSPTPPWIWSAVIAAVEASEGDPAMPRHGLVLPGVLPAQPVDRWNQRNRNLLLYTGCATHIVDASGNVVTEHLITTYQSNALGVPDTSLLEIETVRCASYVRYDGNVSVGLAFARFKLAEDGGELPAGQPILTPLGMKAFLGQRYDIWTALGIVQAAFKQQFMDEMVIGIDAGNASRLVAQAGPTFVRQFRGLSIQWAFIA